MGQLPAGVEWRPMDTRRPRIRHVGAGDLPFLAEMLVEAAYAPGTHPKPTPAQALAEPAVGRYLRDWGRTGDVGLIAEDDAGRSLGAAWYRRFPAEEPGYGFVAPDVPEVAIAVRDGARAKGIGSALLAALIEAARIGGERAVSLSVNPRNEVALRLYQSVGFVEVARPAGDPSTLLLFLLAPPEADCPSDK